MCTHRPTSDAQFPTGSSLDLRRNEHESWSGIQSQQDPAFLYQKLSWVKTTPTTTTKKVTVAEKALEQALVESSSVRGLDVFCRCLASTLGPRHVLRQTMQTQQLN